MPEPAPATSSRSITAASRAARLRAVQRSLGDLRFACWRAAARRRRSTPGGARLAAAIGFRESLKIDATAYRLVHGEADRCRRLVVDRYGDCLVLQALSQGMDRLLPELTQMLVERCSRTASWRATIRGFGCSKGSSSGRGPVRRRCRRRSTSARAVSTTRSIPYHGQKTGLFLDQRENRIAAAGYAHGRAARRLQLQRRLRAGAGAAVRPRCWRSTSRRTRSRGFAANAARNGIANVDARAMNVFDELRELERRGERFDTIVLDPPAFAKNKAAVAKALSGYKEINLRALKLLDAGRLPRHVQLFVQRQRGDVRRRDRRRAAVDAHADVTVVEKRMQGRDHPVLMTVPETYYLKCFILSESWREATASRLRSQRVEPPGASRRYP